MRSPAWRGLFVVLVNSGSSVNLIVISALSSPNLQEGRRIRPGDGVSEVFAVGC